MGVQKVIIINDTDLGEFLDVSNDAVTSGFINSFEVFMKFRKKTGYLVDANLVDGYDDYTDLLSADGSIPSWLIDLTYLAAQ